MKFFCLVTAVSIIVSCSNEDNLAYKVKNDDQILKWKEDSLGCLRYRSENLLDSLFVKYNLFNASFNDIKLLLGKPNYEYKNENYYGLRYYYNSICMNNKIIIDADKCWLEILIPVSQKEENTYKNACE